MRSIPSFALGLVALVSLSACGQSASTATTWVYDEAVTMSRTETEQRPAVRKALAGMQLTLVIDNGRFTMTQVGGPKPSVTTGTSKSDYNGIRMKTLTRDGQPVADEGDISSRQPERGRLELKVDGYTVTLVRK